jgi:hypothetical protein
MSTFPPKIDLLAKLSVSEKTLMRKYGIRLRVEKVTLDGQNALCSAMQVQRRFLRADHTQEAIVEYCQYALAPLYIMGMSPLIRAYPRTRGEQFSAIDANDPFGLWAAMSTKDKIATPAPDTLSIPHVVNAVGNGTV